MHKILVLKCIWAAENMRFYAHYILIYLIAFIILSDIHLSQYVTFSCNLFLVNISGDSSSHKVKCSLYIYNLPIERSVEILFLNMTLNLIAAWYYVCYWSYVNVPKQESISIYSHIQPMKDKPNHTFNIAIPLYNYFFCHKDLFHPVVSYVYIIW